MGKCKGRKFFVFLCEIRQFCDHIDQFLFYDLQSLCHQDDIGIISHIAGGGSQVNDAFCLRALLTVRIHVRHDIVADHLFSFLCHVIIDVFRMGFQLVDLFLCNRKSQLFFCFRQGDPQLPPCAELFIR